MRLSNTIAAIGLAAAAHVAGSSGGLAAPECAKQGPASPAALHREWILVGWEKRVGDPPFEFGDKLGRFYAWSGDDVVLYDDLSPEHQVARSAARYGAIWTPIFRTQREVRHAVLDGPDALLGQDLSATTLEFAARLEGPDGGITGIRDRSSVVWRCTGEGWRIAREHNSSYPVSREEIDRLVPPAAK